MGPIQTGPSDSTHIFSSNLYNPYFQSLTRKTKKINIKAMKMPNLPLLMWKRGKTNFFNKTLFEEESTTFACDALEFEETLNLESGSPDGLIFETK